MIAAVVIMLGLGFHFILPGAPTGTGAVARAAPTDGSLQLGWRPAGIHPSPPAAPVAREYGLKVYQIAEKREIARIAARTGLSIDAVEGQIAASIVHFRRNQDGLARRFPPGQTIIPDEQIQAMVPRTYLNNMGALRPIDQIEDIGASITLSLGKVIDEMDSGTLQHPENLANDDRIYVDLVDVSGTALADASFVGYTVGGKLLLGNEHLQNAQLRALRATPSGRTGYTSVTRAYRLPNSSSYVVLEESDLIAAETVKVTPQSQLNARVGGVPASLARMRNQNGQTQSVLTWTSRGGKEFRLRANGIDQTSVDALIRMAETLSRD